MTAGSNIGYQPIPLPPDDFKEFLIHKQSINQYLQRRFFERRLILGFSPKVIVSQKRKKKSNK
tara:strand:- start:1011 stop:1199 length:189 start_codon:yes stop_codon:yes gene_type:complete